MPSFGRFIIPREGCEKYKVFGEYIDEHFSSVRMKIVFDLYPDREILIIGRLSKNCLSGKIFETGGPKEGWTLELYKSL